MSRVGIEPLLMVCPPRRILGVLFGLLGTENLLGPLLDLLASGAPAGDAGPEDVRARRRDAEIAGVHRSVPAVVVEDDPIPFEGVVAAVDDRVVVGVEADAMAVIGGTSNGIEPPADRLRTLPCHKSTIEDLAGGGEVLLDLQRRHRQHAAVVVESAGGGILGEDRRVEIDADEIADRVAVLRPVEPPQHHRLLPLGELRRHRSARDPVDHGRHVGRIWLRPVFRRHRVAAENIDDLAPLPPGTRMAEIGVEGFRRE